jgi:TetR/AcrR family transcriptional regulator, lmrAB and yxaGH operons repressor
MTVARDQILQATGVLLEKQGCHATGLNEIIRESGAPKGSLYYYFPGGKDQLISEAVLEGARTVAARSREHLALIGLAAFVLRIAENVEASGYAAGSPLTAVAMETATKNERINLACREAYALLIAAFEEYLLASGMAPARATEQAMFITAAIEGGIILSRTQHSAAPLRIVAAYLDSIIAEVK